VALHYAEGDRRRIVVRPSAEALGGGCLIVTNRPRRES
jgi:hypothetical protein